MFSIWRVWKNNRFAGYVVESTIKLAEQKARKLFGIDIRVERILS